VPITAIFPLQRLADALLEQENTRGRRPTVIEHCVEIEKVFLASKHAGQNQPTAISMTAPTRALCEAISLPTRRLYDEKVRFFESSAANSSGIDVMRYQLHLAEAQQGQGNVEKARGDTYLRLCRAEKLFGPQHPRVATIRRKLESIRSSEVALQLFAAGIAAESLALHHSLIGTRSVNAFVPVTPAPWLRSQRP